LTSLAHDREADRLKALAEYRILDTGPEEAYDRIAELARKIFAMPVSLVSLIDERRQWFKAHPGMPVAWVPRRDALCAHTILRNGVLVVPDALSEPMFADNPMVTGAPGIRFYAGAPLRTADGLPLGTLCVIDHEPREFSTEDEAILQDLAQLVMDQMQMRLSGYALQTANEKLAHQATHDSLTGLANRAYFDSRLEEAIAQAAECNGQLAVLYVDLDGFKPVNDRLGHRLGDLVLREVSARLAKVGPRGSTLARLGGDEFVLLLPGVQDGTDAALVSAELAYALEDPIVIEEHEIAVRATVGWSVFPEDGETALKLLQSADSHMYRLKNGSPRLQYESDGDASVVPEDVDRGRGLCEHALPKPTGKADSAAGAGPGDRDCGSQAG
jgi:diguanylate cyclase